MIDLHCHLDLFPRPSEVVARAAAQNSFVLSVTTTPSAWPGTSALAKSHLTIETALGLHPQLAKERLRELGLFDRYLAETMWVGEIGLDGSPENRDFWNEQVQVFEHILKACANSGGRVMSIHSRRASAPVIETIRKFPGAGIAVLHWFSGTARELDLAVQHGCWFSVGAPMICSKKGRDLIARIPRNRILTETDGPFAETNGVPAAPWHVEFAERGLGELWGMDREGTVSLLAENLDTLRSAITIPAKVNS